MLIIGLCHGTPPQEPPWETPSGTPCPRVRLAYSLRQLRVIYHLTTPSILRIVRATSCRLLKYIRSAATVPRSVTLHYAFFTTDTYSTTDSTSLRYYRRCQKQRVYEQLRTTIVRQYSLLATILSPKSNL